MAGTFYIQMEGVNFDAVIFDTTDLSTARGGSLVLRNAVMDAAEKAGKAADAAGFACETVTRGASAAVLRLTGCSERQAEDIAGSIRGWLAGEGLSDAEKKGALGCARHATFTVVVVAEVDANGAPSYLVTKQKLIAATRFAQLAGSTVQSPAASAGAPIRDAVSETSKLHRVCQMDLTRPAVEEQRIKGESLAVSASVRDRRVYGRERKQDFYADELSGHELPITIGGLSLRRKVFALHFATIAGESESAGERTASKLALLYLDGNHFGKRQHDYIVAAGRKAKQDGGSIVDAELAAQQDYDRRLQGLRARLLHRVLETLATEEGGIVTPWQHEREEREALARTDKSFDEERVFAIETLLWGGDELMWVLPARVGWRVACTVMEAMEETDEATGQPVWSLPGRPDDPLTAGIGLVFCKDDAPIARLQPDAKALADIAKQDRKRNRLCYHVLESFDFLAGDAKAIKQRRFARDLPEGMHVLTRTVATGLERAFAKLEPTFPRRRIRRLAQLLITEGPEGKNFKAEQEKMEDDRQLGPLWREIADAIRPFGRQANYCADVADSWQYGAYLLWLHLEELWDYLPTTVGNSQAEQAAQPAAEPADASA